MRKTIFIRKGLAILLTAAMVAGLVPGMGTMQVSAAESDENTVDTVSSNDAVIQNQTDEQVTDKCIITWQWIDEEDILDPETGSLALPGIPYAFKDGDCPIIGLGPILAEVNLHPSRQNIPADERQGDNQ